MIDFKTYIQVNDKGYVVGLNTSTMNPEKFWKIPWIEMKDNYYAYGANLFKRLFNYDGTHNYKFINGDIVECTDEELAQELRSFRKPVYQFESDKEIENCNECPLKKVTYATIECSVSKKSASIMDDIVKLPNCPLRRI